MCSETYDKAQTLMHPAEGQSTLLPAREALRACMRSSCKDWIIADCSRWLAEIEARIPTVVFSARDTAGRDLPDTSVASADGAVVAARLDGRAIEMEPGEQAFVFVSPDGTRREKRVLVREGEKAQAVAAVFDGPKNEVGAASTPGSPTHPGPRALSTTTYVGFGVAAAGVIGLGVGAVYGLSAISKKGDARCEGSLCDDGRALDDARSSATVSTIGFVAGGLLLAGGVALVIFGPRSAPVQARLRGGPASAGIDVTGRF